MTQIDVELSGEQGDALREREPEPGSAIRRVRSHARQTQVRQLSARPTASFARVFASSGAMANTAAHFRSSMCKTGSPRSYRRPGHSSASVVRTSRSGSRSKK